MSWHIFSMAKLASMRESLNREERELYEKHRNKAADTEVPEVNEVNEADQVIDDLPEAEENTDSKRSEKHNNNI